MVLPFEIVRAPTPVVASHRGVVFSDVEDAETVAQGQYAGELSFLSPLHGSATGDSPFGVGFGYGVSSRTEVDLGVGALSGEPNYRRSERDDFGDLSLSVKSRFLEAGTFSVALVGATTWLLADRRRENDLADPSLYLVASKALGKLELVGNVGAISPGSTLRRTVPLLSASAVYDLDRATGLLVQAGENQAQIASPRNKLDLAAGITRGVGSGIELQAFVGRSGRGDRNSGLFLGASYRFGGGR